MKAMNWVWGMIVGCLMAMPSAQAQMAVIDVAAIRQLVVQVNYWRQQITGMQNQLDAVAADARGVDRGSRHGVAAADECGRSAITCPRTGRRCSRCWTAPVRRTER